MKKFLVFISTVLILCAAGFWGYMEFVRPKNYAVFVSSMKHGTVTVEGYEKNGSENDYRVVVPNGDTITLNISPEITDSSYYVLSRLIVNGENVTKSVDMLSYTTEVTSKLSIIAYFKSSDRPESIETPSKLEKNIIKMKKYNSVNKYLGSAGAYGLCDPSVIYEPESGYYYCFASYNRVSRSTDLVNWDDMGTYLKPPAGATDDGIFDFSKIGSVEKWAEENGCGTDYADSSDEMSRAPLSPEIIKVGETYFLYFTVRKNSTDNTSAVFCVRTDDLENAVVTNNWEDAGLVIASAKGDGVCACDPSAFLSDDDELYMAYGGYFGSSGKAQGGIYLLGLDSRTGCISDTSDISMQGDRIYGGEFYSGYCIAKPGKIKNDSDVVSAADVMYVDDTGHYYMIVTYGVEGSSESIRVFRADDVKGPYRDINGKDAKTDKKRNQLEAGTKIAGGYTFTSSESDGVENNELGRCSIGSPCLIKTNNGYVMFAHSGIFESDAKTSLEIRKVIWDENSWPLLSPETYRGEKAQKVDASEMYGIWDVVVFDYNACSDNIFGTENNKSFKTTVFPGVAITEKNIKNGEKLEKLHFSSDGDYRFKITINSVEYKVYAVTAWDSELSCSCVVFTGISEDGSTVWGKKSISSSKALYTDVFDYALELADSKTRAAYEKKFKKISSAPSQTRINTLAANLIAELLK
ncbi:MAG: glycoside hydrolase family 43 protein [Clostridia bacterium]|nr:glycoside hydrolase family 43 protein [Clostridia bacterium]